MTTHMKGLLGFAALALTMALSAGAVAAQGLRQPLQAWQTAVGTAPRRGLRAWQGIQT